MKVKRIISLFAATVMTLCSIGSVYAATSNQNQSEHRTDESKIHRDVKEYVAKTNESGKFSEELIEYVNRAGDDELIPVWIFLNGPSSREIEDLVSRTIDPNLNVDDYIMARRAVLKELCQPLTESVAEKILDSRCRIRFKGCYTAILIADVPKDILVRLSSCENVHDLGLYTNAPLENDENGKNVEFSDDSGKFSKELIAYINQADDHEWIPVRISLKNPSSSEIEDTVFRETDPNSDVNSNDYVMARRTVIKELYQQIVDSFAEEHLDDRCDILYRGNCSAELIAGVPKDILVRPGFCENVQNLSLYVKQQVLTDDDGTGTWIWARESVYAAMRDGLIKGYPDGTFRPDRNLTRAEAAVLLVSALKLDSTDAKRSGFTDVKSDAWYASYVDAAKQAGVIDGYLDGTFAPDAQITRAEITAMIVRAMKYKAGTAPVKFSDVEDTAWYAGFVKTAVENDVVQGYTDGTFAPEKKITRAETVMMLSRALGLL